MMRQIILPAAVLAASLSQPLLAAEFPATLEWSDRTALSLPVSGLVKEVHVRAGQDVEAGTPLVSLDPRAFDARLREARAGVQSLERKRAEAEREARRAEELYARTVLSNVELERAHIEQQQVDGQYQQARARLQQAEIERGYSQLASPFPARVLTVNIAAGEAISATLQAPALVEVARAGVIDAMAALRPEQAQGLRLGDRVEVEVNGERAAGEIHALESLREGGYRLVVRVKTGKDWLAGLPAKVLTP